RADVYELEPKSQIPSSKSQDSLKSQCWDSGLGIWGLGLSARPVATVARRLPPPQSTPSATEFRLRDPRPSPAATETAGARRTDRSSSATPCGQPGPRG